MSHHVGWGSQKEQEIYFRQDDAYENERSMIAAKVKQRLFCAGADGQIYQLMSGLLSYPNIVWQQISCTVKHSNFAT